MLQLIDPQRMKVLGEFERAPGLVMCFVYWQESCGGGGRITLTLEQHGVLFKEYEENGFRWTKQLQERADKHVDSCGLSLWERRGDGISRKVEDARTIPKRGSFSPL